MNPRTTPETTDTVSFPRHLLDLLLHLHTQSAHLIASSFYIYDLLEQRTLCASPSVAVLLGYGEHDIEAMGPFGLGGLIHPDDVERVANHYQQFTTLPPGAVITLEYRMREVNGAWCWLHSQETRLVETIDGFPWQILGLVQYRAALPPPSLRRSAQSLGCREK